MDFETMIPALVLAVEVAGVAVLVGGMVLSSVAFARDWLRSGLGDAYAGCRANLGRTILLGLEFLVVADIILTVTVELDFRSLGALALLVAIRTFLSFALEVEIGGEWPWRRGPESRPHQPATEA